MNRHEFIKQLFAFFKDSSTERMKAYDCGLSVNRPINWDKLYTIVIKDCDKMPSVKYLRAQFDYCRPNMDSSQNGGKKMRVIYQNGKFTDYVVCDFGLNLQEIIQGKNMDNIKEVRLYPQKTIYKDDDGNNWNVDVALIGSNVFPKNTPYEVLYARA